MNNITAMTVPAVSTPSIGSSAMLVELTVGVWAARKKDHQASDAVTESNFAAKGMANVTKRLIKCDELEAVQKFAGNARNTHYAMTMPWSDGGSRLLPTKQYFNYQQTFSGLEAEFNTLVKSFVHAYAWEVSQAQASLGNLFSHGEYPSADAVAGKFRFRVAYTPLPDAGDFRIDVGISAQEQLKASYAEHYKNQLATAMGDVWQRTHLALTNMSTKLDYEDTDEWEDYRTKPSEANPYGIVRRRRVGVNQFKDSLVSNALDMVELLGVCNVTNDPAMEMMQRTLSNAFRGVTAGGLREDEGMRKEVKECVDHALANIPSLGW